MSALANRPFVKMNGLGNEIVIVDMRRQPLSIAAAAARAAASPDGGAPYDQMMALYPPRTAGTESWSASSTATVRKRAPAATACAASPR